MAQTPPPLRDPMKTDSDHLMLLSVFHFALAGLSLVGIAFLLFHYTMMNMFMNSPELWNGAKNAGPPPPQLFELFKWFYLFFGVAIIINSIANLLAGLFIRKRIHRVFTLIVAGLNCLQFPLGTVLGAFTFIILMRDSVQERYGIVRSTT